MRWLPLAALTLLSAPLAWLLTQPLASPEKTQQRAVERPQASFSLERPARELRRPPRPSRWGECSHPNIPDDYDFYFRAAARRHFPPDFLMFWCALKIQCFEESGFRDDAVSPAGAKGRCQHTDATWGELRDSYGLTSRRNPKDSIEGAAIYMGQLLRIVYAPRPQQCKWEFALVMYNWGKGNVNRDVWMVYGSPECVQEVWDVLPKETQGYLTRINETTLAVESRR